MTTSAQSPSGAGVAPPVRRRLGVGPGGERVDPRREVELVGGARRPRARRPPRQTSSCASSAGREVAQVLVHPVRPEPRDDPLLPPRRRADLAPPRPRGVPVVADVVVVEDHRRRHGRQHPADHLLAPRQPVELGVLDEVLDLQARRLVEAAPRGHELLELLVRGGVGVDLVAEQQQHVGPGHLGVVAQRQGQRAQRVDAVRLVALGVVRAASCGRCRTRSAATRFGSSVRMRLGGIPGRGQTGTSSTRHGVGVVAAREQPVEHDEGVVRPVHRHRRRRSRCGRPARR